MCSTYFGKVDKHLKLYVKLETKNLYRLKENRCCTSRFCRLQDTIGDKLLPAWLDILSEKTNVTIDNLDKAEKIGVLPSVDLWLELRQLRNQMIHEYIEDLTLLADALQTANKHLEFIVDVADSIIEDFDKRTIHTV